MSSSSGMRLQWHDHGRDLLDLARDLCGQGELADVTLACSEGRELFSAHRMVLAGASNYFRRVFRGLAGWKHPVVFLKSVSAEQVEHFLQFIYFGEVSVPSHQLESLIATAKELGIKGQTGRISSSTYYIGSLKIVLLFRSGRHQGRFNVIRCPVTPFLLVETLEGGQEEDSQGS